MIRSISVTGGFLSYCFHNPAGLGLDEHAAERRVDRFESRPPTGGGKQNKESLEGEVSVQLTSLYLLVRIRLF